MTFGNFREVVGSEEIDNILGRSSQTLYGLEQDDTLSLIEGNLPDGEATTLVVGGSGNDTYQLENNSSLIVLENGNSNNDLISSNGIGFLKDTSYSLEIDNGRHLFIGDTESQEYALIIDWQNPANHIETFVAADGTSSYEDLVNNLRSFQGYLGSFTWSEAIERGEVNLESVGLSPENVDNAISQVITRAADLEAQASVTGNIVYRFFNDTVGGHLYTIDENERDSIIANNESYNFEGAAYKSADSLTGAPIPVYRFFNTRTGVHLYTVDENERDSIIENPNNFPNFEFEGEKFLAYQEDIGSTIPVYRFYQPNLGVHFYTTDEGEKDSIIEDNSSNYNFEGIAYYSNPLDLV